MKLDVWMLLTITNMADKRMTEILAGLKEGQSVELDNDNNSGKIFTKMAGLFVTQDLDAYQWIKANVSSDFFSTYVARIVSVSRSRSAIATPS